MEPGFRRFRIAPLFDPRFTSAGVTLESASGRIDVSWRRAGDRITMDLVVPANTIADVDLPNVKARYRSGQHRFTI